MTKEEARAEFAEMVARNENDLELDRAALLINPNAAQEIRDRGLVYSGMGRYAAALADLSEYLKRAPQSPDAKEIEEWIRQLKQKQAQLN
jgi:regulator of sirC expression with transglutaminase-like and TPR domain